MLLLFLLLLLGRLWTRCELAWRFFLGRSAFLNVAPLLVVAPSFVGLAFCFCICLAWLSLLGRPAFPNVASLLVVALSFCEVEFWARLGVGSVVLPYGLVGVARWLCVGFLFLYVALFV